MVHDGLRPNRRRKRQTPAQTLAEHDQVGLQPLMLKTVQSAAAAEADLDLIDDDLDAMTPAALLDRRQKSRLAARSVRRRPSSGSMNMAATCCGGQVVAN